MSVASSPNFDLVQAAKYIERTRGRSQHIATIRRWMKKGIGDYGSVVRVKLAHEIIGVKIYTTAKNIEKFFAAVKAIRNGEAIAPTAPTNQAEQAGAELASAGI